MEFTDKQLVKIAERREIEHKNSISTENIEHKNCISNDNSKDWMRKLQKADNGNVLSNVYNVLLILNNDDQLKGKFAYNLLTNKTEITGSVPWERLSEDNGMTDHDDSCLRNYISINYGIRGKEIIYDALSQVASDKKYHPIRDYLKNLEWDEKPRLDSLLIDFFGADDTLLNRCQTRLTMAGAVKRIFQPGCKWDYVLTLKGRQGLGKSSFFEKLAAKREWFSDSIEELKGKEAKDEIQGKWIIELGEMAAVSKGDQKRTKQFITSTHDEYRPAYGRRKIRCPRQCIFVATTNDELPLKDDTGGRRWWIVDVKTAWFENELPLEVDQIWAEAFCVYKEMEAENIPLKLPNHLEEQAKQIQTENTDMGIYNAEIECVLQRGYVEKEDYYGNKTQIPINETCAMHVWEEVLGRYKHDLTKAEAREINAILKSLPFMEKVGRRQFLHYGKQTVYQRIDN